MYLFDEICSGVFRVKTANGDSFGFVKKMENGKWAGYPSWDNCPDCSLFPQEEGFKDSHEAAKDVEENYRDIELVQKVFK